MFILHYRSNKVLEYLMSTLQLIGFNIKSKQMSKTKCVPYFPTYLYNNAFTKPSELTTNIYIYIYFTLTPLCLNKT